jgi:hypothetical protein
LPPGYICAEVNDENITINSFMSPNTQVYKPSLGTDCSSDPYSIYKDKTHFSLGDKNYILWSFENAIKLPDESLDLTWRQALNVILDDTNLHHQRQSINAILPSLFQSVRNRPDSEVFS